MNGEIVSIIGSSYLKPIIDLLEKLQEYDNGIESELMSGYNPNGYAASICLLSVVLLESYVMRSRYIHGAKQDELKTPVIFFLKGKYPDYPYENQTTEIFVVRDLIAHNHLLQTSYTETDLGLEVEGIRRFSSGDKKFQISVNLTTEKTSVLNINTNPIKIGLNDVKKIMCVVWDNLMFLEKKDRNQCYVSQLAVKYKGKMTKLSNIVEELREQNT